MTPKPFKMEGLTFYTPPALLRWPALFTPRITEDDKKAGKDPTYQATFVLSGDEMCIYEGQTVPWLQAFKAEINKFCQQKCGRDVRAMMEQMGQNFVVGVKPNATKTKHAGFGERPNGAFFGAQTKYPLDPVTGIVDVHGRTMQGREAEVYDGCMVIGAVSPYVWDYAQRGRKGINFNLVGVQKVGDGPRLGGTQADFEAAEVYNAPGFDPSQAFTPPPVEQQAPPAQEQGGYPQPGTAAPQPSAPPVASPPTTGNQFF